MSNYSALKTDINNNIYENNTQQITGTVLNTVLKDMVNTLGAGYQFAGCAYLDLNPGAPDAKVFYLAGEGLYTNFDNIQVPAGKLGILKWDTRWRLETIEGLGGGGANLTGYISVASTDDLPDEGQPTIGYLCGTNLYLYVGEGGDTKDGKYQNCGGFRGPEGVGITEIEQVEQSTANGGRNTISIHLSNGSSYDVYTRNGTTSTGLFPTLEALQAAYPSPVVGQYAFVGAGFPADIYVCNTAGTWTDSGADYDGDSVDLTDYATKAELNQLEAELYGINQTSELPYDGWKTQAFNYAWGSSADKIYFDTRVVIDSDHKIKKFTIDSEARSIGTMRVYFIKTSDNSIVTYKEVTLTGAVGFVTFDLELEAEYYANGPMYVGIWSEYVWTCLNGSGIGSATTRELVLSTGVVSTNTSKIWGYGIEISEVADGDIDEINGALTALSGRIGDSEALVDEMSQDLYGSVSEAQRPTATWFNDYVFSSGWGSNTDKIYFDIRNVVDENHKIVKFKIYRLNSGTMRVYFLKQSDYSVVTYKEIQIGPNNGVHTYDLALEDSYYANGPMVVGIWSSFTWGYKNQSNEFPYSYELVMSTGVVTQKASSGWGYGIVVNVHNDGITDKVEKIMPGNDLAEILAKSDDDIVLGPYDYAVTTPIVLTSGMTIRGSFGKTRLILTDGCQTAITASNADGIKISDLEIVGTCPDYAYEMNGIIAGTGYDLVETEADAIALNYMGTEKGIYLYYCENVVLENVKINHITGSAIRVNHVGRDYIKGLNATNLFITNCYNGIFCENEHEFSQYTNWTITLCMIGLYINSGNLIFSAGHATRCRVGVMLVNGTNHAHGIINGVELKHNQIAGLLCNGVTYGQFFANLYVSYSKLIIRDCSGLFFSDMICGNMQIDATGTDGKNLIQNLIRRSYITLQNVETLTIANDVTLF